MAIIHARRVGHLGHVVKVFLIATVCSSPAVLALISRAPSSLPSPIVPALRQQQQQQQPWHMREGMTMAAATRFQSIMEEERRRASASPLQTGYVTPNYLLGPKTKAYRTDTLLYFFHNNCSSSKPLVLPRSSWHNLQSPDVRVDIRPATDAELSLVVDMRLEVFASTLPANNEWKLVNVFPFFFVFPFFLSLPTPLLRMICMYMHITRTI